jgi:hypothetical protein
MRARAFFITGLAVASFLGASATAAHATPQGPGNIDSKPTTTTTPPKGPDKYAPKPTTTTTPPKGPGDIAQPPKGGDDPKPNGPGDIATPPKPPVVDPKPADTGNGSGSDKDYGTTMGDDEGTVDTGSTNSSDTQSSDGNGAVDTTVKPADNAVAPAADHASSNFPTLVIVLVAGVVGALLALFAVRFRRDDEDAHAA